MTNGLKISNTNKGTFYKLTDTITFIIPDKLDSCYNASPMTIFLLIIDDLSFLSRDCETWGAQNFGQISINDEEIDNHSEYDISKRWNVNTERHKLCLIKRYQKYTENILKILQSNKELNIISPTNYETKLQNFSSFINESINKLDNNELPDNIDQKFIKYKELNDIKIWI